MFHPSSRKVASHVDTLNEAKKDATFWSRQTPNPIEIQKRLPSGAWTVVDTVKRRGPMSGTEAAKRPRAHATVKAKVHGAPSDKITIDQLAQLLDLPSWDDVDELNQQHYWEQARGAESEEEQEAAEQAARDEVFNQWYDAVERASSILLGEHDLELQPVGSKSQSRPYQLKIVPSTSWSSSADKIRDTINGVGSFHFNSLREFLASGPYTARQAVLSHLSMIKRRPAVYGSASARRLYDQSW